MRTERPAGRLQPLLLLLMLLLSAGAGLAAEPLSRTALADTSFDWPSVEETLRVLLLRDYNTRVVVIGATLLGLASGLIGTFMFLRKRALMGDAASHATLPGIGLAFLFMTALGADGKNLPVLLIGALLSGLVGMGFILLIRGNTRLKEDAALGIVLSVSFGLGVAILGVVQKMKVGHAAGLESFIYGKTASMLAGDAWTIAAAAIIISLLCTLFYKELALICFDSAFAGAQGWPTLKLDALIMALVVFVTVIGLQAVGLILMVALLIIPPSAARFWTDRLRYMILISAAIGAVSCSFGASISALVPNLPAGAVIVLTASLVFVVSLLFGPARGVVPRMLEQAKLVRKVRRQHLLRALYEWEEEHPPADADSRGASQAYLMDVRTWSLRRLHLLLRQARRAELIRLRSRGGFALTAEGRLEAARVVRNHRLWEIYLIHYADIAPSHVDRDADMIEHVLGESLVARLEQLFREQEGGGVPGSPHRLAVGGVQP